MDTSFRERALLPISVLVVFSTFFISEISTAGIGRIRVVDEGGEQKGELDLTVNLVYDPDDPAYAAYDVATMERYFRTVSTILCDTTEEELKLGRVRFVSSSAGRWDADITVVDGLGHAYGHFLGLGKIGHRITMVTGNFDHGGSLVVTHEMGHYVLGLHDQYGLESGDRGSCGQGVSFGDLSPVSEQNNSIMNQSGIPKCQTRAGDTWTAYPSIDCVSTEDCVHLIDTPVWGMGADDNVRCHPVEASELTSKENHDLDNGLGPGFDQRGTTGEWGLSDDPTWTLGEQLDIYTFMEVSACDSPDAPDCLLGCPSREPTDELSVVVTVPFFSGSATDESLTPEVGDVITVGDGGAWAITAMDAWMYDRIGRMIHEGGRHCDMGADSKHKLVIGLQNIGPIGDGDYKYVLVYTVPNHDFDGTDTSCEPWELNEECNLRVVHVQDLVFSGGPPWASRDFPTFTLTLDDLRINDCYKAALADRTGLDTDTDRDPNPFEVEVSVRGNRGGAPASVEMSSTGHIGDCAWDRGVLECAELWKATGTNLQEGYFASTNASVVPAEWEWATLHRQFPSFVEWDGEAGLPLPENPSCFNYQGRNPTVSKGAYDIEIIDNTGFGAAVFAVIDRSRSMETRDGHSGNTRIESARTALSTYLDTTYDYLDESPDESVDFGLVRYNHDVECFGLGGAGDCALYDLHAERDRLKDQVRAALSSGGRTALMDAVWEAAHELVSRAAPTDERYIYLVTDGRENASTTITDIGDLTAYLEENDIVVYAVAVGNRADVDFLRELLSGQGGVVAYTDTADSLPNALHDVTQKRRGGNMLIPLKQVIAKKDAKIQSPTAEKTKFLVEKGARELVILLTNNGLADGSFSPHGVVEWDLNLRLTSPTDKLYEKYWTQMSPEITYTEDALVRIRIPLPAPGAWSLALRSITGEDLGALMSASVTNPKARLFLDVSPGFVRDGEPVLITPTLDYGGIEIDANQADCTGRLFGPAGFELTLSFDNTEQRERDGEPPQSSVQWLGGRGAYRAEVTCDVPASAKPPRRSGTDINLVPYQYTATGYFFLDSNKMPPCETDDCDNDGIPNKEEYYGDSDGDGWPDPYDDDSDNDDVMDGDDNCPVKPNHDQKDSNQNGIGDACDKYDRFPWETGVFLPDRHFGPVK